MITTNVNGNPISSGFISEIQSDSPNVIARLWYDDAELSCDIVNIIVEKGSCGSNPFMIGEVVGDMLHATVKNLTESIKGKVIECHIGAMVNGEYEYISLGEFKVSDVRKTRYQSEIIAYSGVVANSSGDFNASGLNNPTIAEIAVRLQSDLNCTISFDSGIDTTVEVTAQLTGLTDYQVLQVLAICCGGYVVNTIDGNVVVKKYSAVPTLTVDTGMMVTLPEIAEMPYRVRNVGVLVSEATEDNEGQAVDEVYYTLPSQGYIKVLKQGTEYYLKDASGNRIIADIRPELADLYFSCIYMTEDMFNANIKQIVGYEYYPATINLTLGDPRLEGSDVLWVEEIDGSLYVVPCHKIIHKYTGGLSTQVRSADASDEANDIGTVMPITQRLQSMDRQTGKAQATADNAYRIADNTNQYFWFKGNDPDETGAHITEVPQEQWEDPESPYYHSGGNLLARSNGIAVRNGLTELATFGANGAQIGVSTGGHTIIESSGMKVFGSSGTEELANIGYGSGHAQSGTANAPYYTFGTRTGDIGNYSVAEGYDVEASGWCSYAHGGFYNTSGGKRYTVASHECSHAEGYGAQATGLGSHAEGWGTTASASMSHAEGDKTVASGAESHAEGDGTVASGGASHAEGGGTVASGAWSHAGGRGTTAQGTAQTAIGRYNIADTTSLLIVGNGSSENSQSNAFLVDNNGNVYVKGSLYVRCNDDSSGGIRLIYLSGDTINFTCSLASYLTNSATEITVTVPLAKYIKATGFTATSLQLCTRQNGQYTHGSSANTYATWTQANATIYDGTLHLTMRNSTTTNAVNNTPIGILMKIQGYFFNT